MKKTAISILLSAVAMVLTPGCSGHGGSEHEHEHEHGHSHGHANEGEEDLILSAVQMKTVGIELGTMELREISSAVTASGSLEVNPQDEAVAAPLLSGTVSRLLVTEGQKVSKGQVLAYVDAPEILQLRLDLREARLEKATATKEADRQRALAARGAGIRMNLDNAVAQEELASARLQSASSRLVAYGVSPDGQGAQIAVKSPVSGTVTSVIASIGDFTDMQSPVAKIVNTSAIFCTLSVSEKDIASLAPGNDVSLRLTSNPDVTLSGKISSVNPVLDSADRTVPVRVEIAGMRASDVRLLPGMAVTASITTNGGSQSEALPENAVVSTGGKSYIFVLEKETGQGDQASYHFEKVEVIKGKTSEGFLAVTPVKALSPDARIVTKGAFYLSSMSTDHGEHNH